ncbi:MAG TPA: glycosyl hydrolase family 65 protein, partial [Sandaracinaceae bacterium]
DASGCHYPATYIAGGYDRRRSRVAERWVENEDLVCWPNWLCLSFRPEGGRWLDLDDLEIVEFRQTLDMRRGLLHRRVVVREHVRETELVSRRIVSMHDPHVGAIEQRIRPINWSGRITVRSALDGNVANRGVARYRALEGRHVVVLGTGLAGEEVVHLTVETIQSKIRASFAARLRAFLEDEPASIDRRTVEHSGLVAQEFDCQIGAGECLRIEKVVAIYTSRDRAISEPLYAASHAAQRAPEFSTIAAAHERAWDRLWRRFDTKVVPRAPDETVQSILRLHVFHLLQSVSPHNVDLDAGVPARGLHGEAYRGHVFWDELFILPLLNQCAPEVTRALLMYRYRRLPEARRMAREAGHRGAMFPWQSGSDGREESQIVHLNPRSGRWVPDETHLQRHVNAAIAYNVWQYFEATGDLEHLATYGAEILLEIARFFASLATYDAKDGRYHVRNVVGPDEYHTRDPNRPGPGVDDNAYTNVMVAWTLRAALRALDVLAADRRRELFEELEMTDGDVVRFEEIARRMYVPFLDGRILAQFEGYGALAEFDWDAYRAKYGDIQRLDRILEAEGDSPNRYKASKQADVLMLFYLFGSRELTELLGSMGYEFDSSAIPDTIDYYLARTSDGSTLSRVVHAWVLSRADRPGSYELFRQALASDIDDIQRGTTSEGIHLGAMAGTVDIARRCYGGIEMRGGVLWLDPRLPDELVSLDLQVRYRGHWLELSIGHDRVRIAFHRGPCERVRVVVRGTTYTFEQGQSREIELRPAQPPSAVVS